MLTLAIVLTIAAVAVGAYCVLREEKAEALGRPNLHDYEIAAETVRRLRTIRRDHGLKPDLTQRYLDKEFVLPRGFGHWHLLWSVDRLIAKIEKRYHLTVEPADAKQ